METPDVDRERKILICFSSFLVDDLYLQVDIMCVNVYE